MEVIDGIFGSLVRLPLYSWNILYVVTLIITAYGFVALSRSAQNKFHEDNTKHAVFCLSYSGKALIKDYLRHGKRTRLLSVHFAFLIILLVASWQISLIVEEGYRITAVWIFLAFIKVPWFAYVALVTWFLMMRQPAKVCVTGSSLVISGMAFYDYRNFLLFDAGRSLIPLTSLRGCTRKDNVLLVECSQRYIKQATLLLPYNERLEAAIHDSIEQNALMNR